MGLKSNLRRWLVRNGYRVPGVLIREHDRLFHETVNAVRPGMVVLDLGANKGDVAAAFAARGAIVHAYEPNPDIYARLLKAAERDPRIHPHNSGVLDQKTEMKLYLHTDYNTDSLKHSESSSLLTEKPNVSADVFRMVPVEDIDDIIAEIGEIDIAKIDVEGAEYRIISRMLATGSYEKIGRIMVETHHDRIESLRPQFEAIEAEIARLGVGERFRFDWA